MASESLPWRSLHPGSIAVNLLPRTIGVLRAGWPILVLMWMRGDEVASSALGDAALVMIVFLLTVGRTLLHFLTLRYRVHEGRLEIRSGLLYRQVRAIDPERIQNVELARNVAHRLTGLVEVRVETASGTEVEGLLSALTVEDAEELVQVLEQARRRTARSEDEEPEEDVVVANSVVDLVRYGATAARVGALALVAVGFSSDAGRWLAPDEAAVIQARFTWMLGVVVGVGTLTGAWLAGIALAVVRHWAFRLVLSEDRLIATEGLLSTRRVELRRPKVQLVLVNETLPRRLAGFGSVQIETAAVREPTGGQGASEAVVPVVETADIDRVVRIALPGLDLDLDAPDFRRPHPRALLRMLISTGLSMVFLVAMSVGLAGVWGWLALVLLPANLIATYLDFRMQGWRVTERVVVARRGYWNRRTLVVDRSRLQSIMVEEGPLQRVLGLASVRVRVAGSSVLLPELEAEATYELLSHLRSGAPSA